MWAQEISVSPVKTKLHGNVYGPAFFRDHIMVCSDQKGKLGKTIYDKTGHHTTNLFIITDTNGTIEAVDEKFISDYNDGPATFDDNGGYMVLSRNIHSKRSLIKFQEDKKSYGVVLVRVHISWMGTS